MAAIVHEHSQPKRTKSPRIPVSLDPFSLQATEDDVEKSITINVQWHVHEIRQWTVLLVVDLAFDFTKCHTDLVNELQPRIIDVDERVVIRGLLKNDLGTRLA